MIEIGLGRTLVALGEFEAAHEVFERANKAEHSGLGSGTRRSLDGR
jgi:hypothetical protein